MSSNRMNRSRSDNNLSLRARGMQASPRYDLHPNSTVQATATAQESSTESAAMDVRPVLSTPIPFQNVPSVRSPPRDGVSASVDGSQIVLGNPLPWPLPAQLPGNFVNASSPPVSEYSIISNSPRIMSPSLQLHGHQSVTQAPSTGNAVLLAS